MESYLRCEKAGQRKSELKKAQIQQGASEKAMPEKFLPILPMEEVRAGKVGDSSTLNPLLFLLDPLL